MERNKKGNKFCYIVLLHGKQNLTLWSLLHWGSTQDLSKVRVKRKCTLRKGNCGESNQRDRRVMLLLHLWWNGTQRPNIRWCERLCMKCYYCHDDDWMHVEITFTGIATNDLCIFPSYSSKALKAAFLINKKQASHTRAKRNNLSMQALLWIKC